MKHNVLRGVNLLPKMALLPLCISLISGCGSSSSSGTDTDTDTSDPSDSTTLGSTDSSTSTLGVGCDYNYSEFNSTAAVDEDGNGENLTEGYQSTSSWTCGTSERTVVANGIPDHDVGEFPNAGNPNAITTVDVDQSYTTSPTLANAVTVMGGPRGPQGYVLNGVKIDASTAGSCVDNATSTTTNGANADCSLIDNSNGWSIEAVGQNSFDFGTDDNNAHVQPNGGGYHYHGMPEGFVTLQGGDDTKMTMIGWAADGFPIYARYGYTDPDDASSAIKVMTGSYQTDADNVPSDRASVDVIPLGTFAQDWAYVAGSGDLDECNGRTGVTPEFPNGIYHYYATDSYPYFQRCVSGEVESTGGPGTQGPPPG